MIVLLSEERNTTTGCVSNAIFTVQIALSLQLFGYETNTQSLNQTIKETENRKSKYTYTELSCSSGKLTLVSSISVTSKTPDNKTNPRKTDN